VSDRSFPFVDEDSGFVGARVLKQFRTPAGRFTAVDDVSFQFAAGEIWGIVGESGSGKSTLARMLVGLEAPSGGGLRYRGKPVADLVRYRGFRIPFRRDVQFIAQDTTSSFDSRLTLRASLRLPVRNLLPLRGSAVDERIDETLARLEIPAELADRYPDQVSGGQRQRFAIARALVVRPRLLVCDEVVSALDVSVQGAVLNLLKDYSRTTGAGIVFVSHGLPATAFLADRIAVMRLGRILETADTATLLAAPRHPYTRQLLDVQSPPLLPAREDAEPAPAEPLEPTESRPTLEHRT